MPREPPIESGQAVAKLPCRVGYYSGWFFRVTLRMQTSTTLLILLAVGYTAAVPANPLHDHDNGPLTGIFGLPDSTEGALLAADGEFAWAALVTTASHSIAETSGGETFVLDGESTRAELRLRYGLGSRLEIGIELPWMWQQSGSLDSAIDSWHQFFGFPDGARDDRPTDVLEFSFVDAAGQQLNVNQNSNGIGDVRLFAGYQLESTGAHRTAIRLGVKIPTGAGEDLHGSGGTDLSLGIAGDWLSLAGSERFSGFYRLHVAYLGEPEWLADRSEEWAAQVSGGVNFKVTPRISLAVQSTLRSALYDAEVDGLGDPAMTLTFGGKVQMSDRWQLELAVGEDIKVGSGPDVSFQLGLVYNPR